MISLCHIFISQPYPEAHNLVGATCKEYGLIELVPGNSVYLRIYLNYFEAFFLKCSQEVGTILSVKSHDKAYLIKESVWNKEVR